MCSLHFEIASIRVSCLAYILYSIPTVAGIRTPMIEKPGTEEFSAINRIKIPMNSSISTSVTSIPKFPPFLAVES